MENDFKVEDIVLTLDTKDKEFYYKIINSYNDSAGATWFTLEGVFQKEKVNYPLLHMKKMYVKLESSETKILIGASHGIH